MIKELQRTSAANNEVVLHYFCRFDSRKQQTELEIMRSLVCQLLQLGKYGILEDVNDLRASHPSEPDPDELPSILAKVVQKSTTYLVIDGLDELENPKKTIQRMQAFFEAGGHVMITSRLHPDISRAFSDATWMEVLADQTDIRAYVEQRFADSDFADYVGKGHSIVDLVAEKAGDM